MHDPVALVSHFKCTMARQCGLVVQQIHDPGSDALDGLAVIAGSCITQMPQHWFPQRFGPVSA
jgi:hypothetical protein